MVRKKIEGFIIVTQRGDGVEGQGGRVGGRWRVGSRGSTTMASGEEGIPRYSTEEEREAVGSFVFQYFYIFIDSNGFS